MNETHQHEHPSFKSCRGLVNHPDEGNAKKRMWWGLTAGRIR
jgi:hypothetical protein